MKISSITYAVLLTVASVDAAAQTWSSAQPTTQPQLIYEAKKAVRRHGGDDECRGSGQMCGIKANSKRFAEAAAHIDSTNDATTVSESLRSKRAAAAAPAIDVTIAAEPTTEVQLIHDVDKAVRPHGGEACRGSGQVCGIKAKLKRVAEAAAQMDSTNDPTTVSKSLKAKRVAAAAPAIDVTVAAEPTTEVQLIHDAVKAVQPHGGDACRGSGQVCGIKAKLKRAASAAASALADPIVFAEPPHRFCYKPDGECSNAKREALALAEAAAEAYALAEPEANPCYLPGGECSNAKREALAAAEEMAERDAGAFPDAEAGKPPVFLTL